MDRDRELCTKAAEHRHGVFPYPTDEPRPDPAGTAGFAAQARREQVKLLQRGRRAGAQESFMIRRWTALGVVTAEKKFHRIKGYRHMGALVHARIIEALNERFGLNLGPEHRVTLEHIRSDR